MPSEQMSCVADANATIHMIAMIEAKYEWMLRASPIRTNKTPMKNSVDRTQNFFVLNMSRNPAQSDFNDHTMTMLAVATVISLSLWPRSLNMVPATQMTTEKGIPIAT